MSWIPMDFSTLPLARSITGRPQTEALVVPIRPELRRAAGQGAPAGYPARTDSREIKAGPRSRRLRILSAFGWNSQSGRGRLLLLPSGHALSPMRYSRQVESAKGRPHGMAFVSWARGGPDTARPIAKLHPPLRQITRKAV
jgi:hypothetical protein